MGSVEDDEGMAVMVGFAETGDAPIALGEVSEGLEEPGADLGVVLAADFNNGFLGGFCDCSCSVCFDPTFTFWFCWFWIWL